MNERRRILYLAAGGEKSSSMAKSRALQRLGHVVTTLNLTDCLPRNIWLRRLNNWTGYAVCQTATQKFVSEGIAGRMFDVAWVDSGHMVGPEVLTLLRRHARHIVNYNHDDPTGVRDGKAWGSFKRAIPGYDLMVTVRVETEAELKSLGAKRVVRVLRSYDEVDHRPREISADDLARWGTDVVFVGTWMPERGPFMASLLKNGIPLTIYGDFWSKSREWTILKKAWRGPAIFGDDYAKVIQCSKIALGLLSKGNRDLHTQRTSEIPALGGLLCAERTDEHLSLFREGEEAVFWRDSGECSQQCQRLLLNDEERLKIRVAGREAVIKLGLGHEKVLSSILSRLL